MWEGVWLNFLDTLLLHRLIVLELRLYWNYVANGLGSSCLAISSCFLLGLLVSFHIRVASSASRTNIEELGTHP